MQHWYFILGSNSWVTTVSSSSPLAIKYHGFRVVFSNSQLLKPLVSNSPRYLALWFGKHHMIRCFNDALGSESNRFTVQRNDYPLIEDTVNQSLRQPSKTTWPDSVGWGSKCLRPISGKSQVTCDLAIFTLMLTKNYSMCLENKTNWVNLHCRIALGFPLPP